MDNRTLWSSSLDGSCNDELSSDSLNGEIATMSATTAPTSALSVDKTGESGCSPMILDSYASLSNEGQESSNTKDDGSHLLDMDHSVDTADRPSEDLSLVFATNELDGVSLPLASHTLTSLDPTTLAVANLDDDYWQFIHSDLMATDTLNANALQYLSESTSTLHEHNEHGHSSAQPAMEGQHGSTNETSTSFSIPIKTEPLSPNALMASTTMTATADPMIGAFFDQTMLPTSFYATDIKPSLLLSGQDDIAWLTNMVTMPATATPASLMANPSFVPLTTQPTPSSSSSTATATAAKVPATPAKRGRKKRDAYATSTFNTQLQPLKPTPTTITSANSSTSTSITATAITTANTTTASILPASAKADGKRATNRAKTTTSSETSASPDDQIIGTKRRISRKITAVGATATTSTLASATTAASTAATLVSSPPKLAPALSTNTSGSSTPLRPFPIVTATNLLPSLATATNATANTANSTTTTTTTANPSITNGATTTTTLTASPPDSTLTSLSTSHDASQIVYDKRQQRLIKNRAAALMSRKRKREHLASLEQQAEELKSDNDQLRMQLAEKESRITAVEQERDEAQHQLNELQVKLAQLQEQLKLSQERHASLASDSQADNHQDTCNMDVEKDTSIRLHRDHSHTNGESRIIKSTSTAGMVFMAIIFSFAILSLPVARITLPLTTGGSSGSSGSGNNEGQAIHAQPVFSRMPPLNSTPLPSSKLDQTKQQTPSKLRHADSDVDEDDDNHNTDKRRTTATTTKTMTDQDVDMMILSNVKSEKSSKTKSTSPLTMITRSKLSASAAAASAASTSTSFSSTATSSNNPRPVSMMQRRQSRRQTCRRSSASSSGGSMTEQHQHLRDTPYSTLSTKVAASSNTASSTDISSINQARMARDLYNWLIQQDSSTVDQHTKSFGSLTSVDGTAMDMDTITATTSTDPNSNIIPKHLKQSSIHSTQTHFLFDSLKPIMPVVSLPPMTGNWQPIEDDNELSSTTTTAAASLLSSSSQGPRLNAYTCISPGKNGERPRISFLSPIENHCWSIHRSSSASPAPASPYSMHSTPATSSSEHESTILDKSIDESIINTTSDVMTSTNTTGATSTASTTTAASSSTTEKGSDTTLNHLMDVSDKRDTIEDIEDTVSSDLQRYLRIDVEVVSSHLVEGLPK